MKGVLEVPLLVVVFLLDLWVDINALRLLVLDVFDQVLVHGNLQGVVFVDVLDHAVYSVLEVVDVHPVVANEVSVLHNHLLHGLLTGAEIVNHETKLGIDRVILPQFFVHLVRLDSEEEYLLLSRCDVPSELLDLVVEDVFELLELLCLLLEVEDFLLICCNYSVFVDNFLAVSLEILSQAVNLLLRGVVVRLFVPDLVSNPLDLLINLLKLRFRELKLCTRPQTHVSDLTQVSLVLRFDLFNLLACIIVNLGHCLSVLLFDLLDCSFELLYLVLLDFDVIVVGAHLLVELLLVLFDHVLLNLSELGRFFLSLVL